MCADEGLSDGKNFTSEDSNPVDPSHLFRLPKGQKLLN